MINASQVTHSANIKVNQGPSFAVRAIRDIAGGALGGAAVYGAFRFFRYMQWIQPSNLFIGHYVAAFAIPQIFLKLLELVHISVMKLIGPREKYAEPQAIDQPGRLDRFRMHVWKVITQLERLPKIIDQKVCEKLGIHTNEEIRRQNIPFDELYALEKIRFVFWKAIKETLSTAFSVAAPIAILTKLGAYTFVATTLTPAGLAGLLGLTFLGTLARKIENLRKQAEMKRGLEKWIDEEFAKTHQLETIERLDLRECPHLSPLFLSLLLPKCPSLKKIQLDAKAIARVRGFEATQLHAKIKVEVLPFASHCYQSLWTDQKYAFLMEKQTTVKDPETDEEKKVSIHRAVLAQCFQTQFDPRFEDFFNLKEGKLGFGGSINKKMVQWSRPRGDQIAEKIVSDSFLNFAYTGEIELCRLNEAANWLDRSSLFKKNNYSDGEFVLEFADKDVKIPIHKALIAIRSPVLMQKFKENLNEKEYKFSVDPEIVLEILHFMYEGTINLKAVKDKEKLIKLALDWQVEGLVAKIEAGLQAEVNLIKLDSKNTDKQLEVYLTLAEKFNLPNLCKIAKEKSLLKKLEMIQVGDILKNILNSAQAEGYQLVVEACVNKIKQHTNPDLFLTLSDDSVNVVHSALLAHKALKFAGPIDPKTIGKVASRAIIEKVIHFIYSGQINPDTTLEEYVEMVKVAHAWNIPSLLNYVDQYFRQLVEKGLDLEHLLSLKEIAAQINLAQFVSFCDQKEREISRLDVERMSIKAIINEKPSQDKIEAHRKWAKEAGFKRIERYCDYLLRKKHIYWRFIERPV